MQVRLANDNDIEAINKLEQDSFTDAWSEALISNMFSNSFDTIMVLEDEGEIIGYINYRDIGGDVDLMALCIAKEHRGNGYSKLLMDSLMAHPCKQIILEVRDSNIVAQNLYESYGFAKYARRKDYYTSPIEDAIIMIYKHSS